MERYVCIHGHFYQPPRENPWLEAVERQDSAHPYHDWNERISAECYAANGAARILDDEGRVVDVVNNYARISFNVGPTLLAWLERNDAGAYAAILAADQESQRRFGGHGSAIAQAYNHAILPLATRRDKETQVRWGVRDFARRFGRRPEGMWLPETAVDLETLEVLAEQDIVFTVLAQHQAARVRRRGQPGWRDVRGGHVDPTTAYRVALPSGREIAVFFYDAPIARALAFERLLVRAEDLVARLAGAFADGRDWPQLVHVATDGETYGHHHRYGDRALAHALAQVEALGVARLTNYGEYLERHPAVHEAQIVPGTSWSCAHGLERWRADCGCSSGGHPGWTQGWRAPLREALDWLGGRLDERVAAVGGELLRDPRAALDDYVAVVLDRSDESVARFLGQHRARPLGPDDEVRALELLEMGRHAQLMYTSCGWFFDEVSGPETVQVLRYAARALQLAQALGGDDIETPFLERLARVPSNLPEHGDGRAVYDALVRPAVVDLPGVGAHYAVSSLFESYGDRAAVYCYQVDREDYRQSSAGRARLALGRATVTSEITRESARLSFGVLHLGDHNLVGGVRPYRGEDAYALLVREVDAAFAGADMGEVVRLIDREFGAGTYSLKLLFRDEQRRVLETITDVTLAETEATYQRLYDHHAPLIRFLAEVGGVPAGLRQAAEVALNGALRRVLAVDEPDAPRAAGLLAEAAATGVALDGPGLGFALGRTIRRLAEQWRADPTDLAALQRLGAATELAATLPFEVDAWRAQNVFFAVGRDVFPEIARSEDAAGGARAWLDAFAALGARLRVVVPELVLDAEDGSTRAASGAAPPAVVAAVRAVLDERRVPDGLYRLQLGPDLDFRGAAALAPYLDALGVSDCHASPILQPRRGSTHGYDVSDHASLNPALGSLDDFGAWTAARRAHGLGLVLDVVPNHMGIGGEAANRWWRDVLEHGPSSIYADYFDVDWRPARSELRDKVLLPILGEPYGRALERGELRLVYADGAFAVRYYDTLLPLEPRSYRLVLAPRLGEVADRLGAGHEQTIELEGILGALTALPPRTETAPERARERHRETAVVKRRLAALYASSLSVRGAVDAAVAEVNGTAGDPASFDRLDALLDAQAFRPAYWRVAAEEINYRRFFDVNELAAIRVERPEVFHATHQLVLRLAAQGEVTGFRIDHPDGLWNPRVYLRRLQMAYLRRRVESTLGQPVEPAGLEAARAAVAAKGPGQPAWPLYVVAEKVLAPGEPLPADWAVDGTTGYDFLNAVGGLLVDRRARRAFDRLYADLLGHEVDFDDLLNRSKKMIMLVSLASEVNALAQQLARIAARDRRYRDLTVGSLTFALREVVAALPVYRTYTSSLRDGVAAPDRAYVAAAVAEAKRRNPRTAEEVFDFVGDVLALRGVDSFREEVRPRLLEFVMKLQQVSPPVMAKGAEDTAFYAYNRLVGLNEVGGDPAAFGVSVAAFHRQNLRRARAWPHAVSTTSTHDTKRSEDVRARLAVLSEMPAEWRAAVERFVRLNGTARGVADGRPAPDRNDEYLLYQTLVGAWPDGADSGEPVAAFRGRVQAYMRKAVKEAKVHTSWVNPNEPYEAALGAFVDRVVADDPADPFRCQLDPLRRRVAYFGVFNALGQLLLKLASPGVPEIYQGQELWDYSLVDPDNRRPVDFERRRVLLEELRCTTDRIRPDARFFAASLLRESGDGRVKLWVTHRGLALRRAEPGLFRHGRYAPLVAAGRGREHLCAFARVADDAAAIAIAPRLTLKLAGGVERPPVGDLWGDTRLDLPPEVPAGVYRDAFTGVALNVPGGGGALRLSEALGNFPVALLSRVR